MARRLTAIAAALSVPVLLALAALWVWRSVDPAAAARLLDAAPIALHFPSDDVRVGGSAYGGTARLLRPAHYAVRAGDLVVIAIPELTGPGEVFSKSQRVSGDGGITLPFL